jgi:hypothetical protein
MQEDDTDEILGQADALIRRHRVFASGDAASPIPDDDIPVLTEIVNDAQLKNGFVNQLENSFATAPVHVQQHLDALREELTRWLNNELPQTVLKVTDGLADQLMAELTHQAEQKLLPRLIARLDGTALLQSTAESPAGSPEKDA